MIAAHIYIATDSTLAKATLKYYGYVLECEVAGQVMTREGFGEITATYHRAVLAAIIEALKRFRKPCEISIHTENTYVLRMLEHNLAVWAEHDFINSKGKPVGNQEEWQQLWQLSQEQLLLAVPGLHAYSNWLQAAIEKYKKQKEKGNV